MASIKDLTGQKFNLLTPIKILYNKGYYTYWECLCDCGNITKVSDNSLKSGNVKSCGCLQRKSRTTHGMYKSRIYSIWEKMIRRCTNPNNQAYPRYGGRNITVCDLWMKFENFYKDNGDSYLKHVEEFGEKETTLDRWPNVDGNYEPGNVRWATWEEQANNRRSTPILGNKKEQKRWKVLFSLNIARILRGHKDAKIALCDKYFGASVIEVREYLLSLLQSGMFIENYGRGLGKWCIDHIIGCNNFDLSKEEDRYKCFNINNLQPKWWEDNSSKSKSKVNSNR